MLEMSCGAAKGTGKAPSQPQQRTPFLSKCAVPPQVFLERRAARPASSAGSANEEALPPRPKGSEDQQ